MSMGMYFLQITKEQLDEIENDEDMFYEISHSDEADEINIGFDSEFFTIGFLLTDKAFHYEQPQSPNYYFRSRRLTNSFDSYLDVDAVKHIAKQFKLFTENELKRRYLSKAFKSALSLNKVECDGGFGNEEYFRFLWSSVNALSNYFIEAAKQNKGMLFWYV